MEEDFAARVTEDGDQEEFVDEAGQSVGLILDRQLDVSRGDWIGTPETLLPAQRFGATLAWLDDPLRAAAPRPWRRQRQATRPAWAAGLFPCACVGRGAWARPPPCPAACRRAVNARWRARRPRAAGSAGG